jgi:hypothetical protein
MNGPPREHPQSRAAKVSRAAARAKRHSPGLLEPKRRIGDGVGGGGYLLPTNRLQHVSNPIATNTPPLSQMFSVQTPANPGSWRRWVVLDSISPAMSGTKTPGVVGIVAFSVLHHTVGSQAGRQLLALAPCPCRPRRFEWSSLTFSWWWRPSEPTFDHPRFGVAVSFGG